MTVVFTALLLWICSPALAAERLAVLELEGKSLNQEERALLTDTVRGGVISALSCKNTEAAKLAAKKLPPIYDGETVKLWWPRCPTVSRSAHRGLNASRSACNRTSVALIRGSSRSIIHTSGLVGSRSPRSTTNRT